MATEEGWRARAVAICIPVRNEQALLPASLDALANLEADAGMEVTICFLLDGCRDRSSELVAAFAARSSRRVIVAAMADDGISNAGRARGAAMEIGRRALGREVNAALLTTDADTLPAPDWILATCHALSFSDLVAGRIVRENAGSEPVQDRLERYYDRLYAVRRTHDPIAWEEWPAHHHTGGASLAFRAEAYAALGGFRPIASAEDATIVDDAHRLGLRVRRDRAVVVTTSSRRRGRAVNGLADHLRSLSADAADIRVVHPEQASWQYRGHALARACFGRIGHDDVALTLATQLGVGTDDIGRAAIRARNAEAFATLVVPAPPGVERHVSLPEAEAAVQRLGPLGYDCAA